MITFSMVVIRSYLLVELGFRIARGSKGFRFGGLGTAHCTEVLQPSSNHASVTLGVYGSRFQFFGALGFGAITLYPKPRLRVLAQLRGPGGSGTA